MATSERSEKEEKPVQEILDILVKNSNIFKDSLKEIARILYNLSTDPQIHFFLRGLNEQIQPRILECLTQTQHFDHAIVQRKEDLESLGLERISSMGENGYAEYLINGRNE